MEAKNGIPYNRLFKIVHEIEAHGCANRTRLTVLKKWFEKPERLCSFALWIARQAYSKGGKATGTSAQLLRESRQLLSGLDWARPRLAKRAARDLHDRLHHFQSEYQKQRWGPVRRIQNWDLLLVENALAICLWYRNYPEHGYKLAADYCQHYDSRYGSNLNGPSKKKIEEIIRFISTMKTIEDE